MLSTPRGGKGAVSHRIQLLTYYLLWFSRKDNAFVPPISFEHLSDLALPPSIDENPDCSV